MVAQFEFVDENDFFISLFYLAAVIINAGHASKNEIRESVQRFVDYFREHRSPARAFAANRFQSHADFLGYFEWHSALSAAVTRNKALVAINNCRKFKSCFNRELLNVVSVGGGPGSDLVGLYSAICHHATFHVMNILSIDNINWTQYFAEIHGSLREGNFGNASQLNIHRRINASFILADMENALIPVEAFRRANLVWMKGFLSALSNDVARRDVTNRIISLITRGALLVVMDSPAYDQFDYFVYSNQLRRLYSTNGGYQLQLNSQPANRIMTSTNQEIIIFEKI